MAKMSSINIKIKHNRDVVSDREARPACSKQMTVANSIELLDPHVTARNLGGPKQVGIGIQGCHLFEDWCSA